MDYKGLRDNHLNVFWNYDGKPALENNITKSFINTIDGLNYEQKTILFKELFGIDISNATCRFKYFLQRKGTTLAEEVKKVPESNRIMFCFSPKPEHKGYKGQDKKDWVAVSEDIWKEVAEEYPDDKKTQKIEFDKRLEECKRSADRDGSTPDACIFVYKNEKPIYVIAMENKLYALDPYQINNHIEKSLLILEGTKKKAPIYKGYDEICSLFERPKFYESWICQQYLEYMTILHYRKPENFISICDAEPNLRQWLAFNCFGEDLASKVHEGKVDKRNWNTWRINVGYDYLREINIVFETNNVLGSTGVGISLCFGPNQSCAKKMLERVDSVNLRDCHIKNYGRGLHLFRYPCQNVGQSYADFKSKSPDKLDKLNEYINYWKENIDLIPNGIISPEDASNIYSKLLFDKKIDKDSFDKLNETILHRYSKTNKYTLVPEVEIRWYWSYEQIAEMGETAFVRQMKDAIDRTLKEMKLK